MSYRYMRILLFFDLPTQTSKQRYNYSKFRRFLIKEGFIMCQYSVYTKLVLNNTVSDLIKIKVRKNSPSEGSIQMLTITEKQFSNMEILLGNTQEKVEDSTDRLVIL